MKLRGAIRIDEELISKFQKLLRTTAESDAFVRERIGGMNLARKFELGLIPNERQYGAYRGRICFPVRDAYGRLIAIQARALTDQQQPKYLHPKGFQKAKFLYGLHLSKELAYQKKRIVVVEGPMDEIACMRVGEPAGGLLGSALSPWHIALLCRYVHRIIFMSDGDRAGDNAANKAIEVAAVYGVRLDFRFLSRGSDPASILESHGARTLREIIRG